MTDTQTVDFPVDAPDSEIDRYHRRVTDWRLGNSTADFRHHMFVPYRVIRTSSRIICRYADHDAIWLRDPDGTGFRLDRIDFDRAPDSF